MGFHHGLSGLNASSKNLDVIGHNIANSNTVGFKSSRAEFNEMVASAMGASSSNNTGIGVSVAAVSQQFTQGVITPSANGLDMAINGDGFFVVQTGTGIAYTRNGAFQLNKGGELVTVNGDQVQGYPIDPNTGLRTSVSLTNLVFPTGTPIAAKQTDNVKATLNLDARVDQNANPAPPRATYGTSLEVFDEQGMATPLSMYFQKTGANTWDVYDSLDPNAAPIGRLMFDSTGKLDGVAPYAGLGVDPNGLNPGDAGYETTHTFGTPTGTTLSTQVATTNPNNPNPGPWNVNIDLGSVSQRGSAFSVAKLTQDGYASGELTSVNVASDGTLLATYSNGITRAEAQVALAKFTNSQGLQPDGNNNWVASNDSGPPVYGTAGTGSFGTIAGSALEESNVDLTAQLVGMMTAQRAYQANAQTIKTQDQIFSTLVNLR
ncbi:MULTISPECIES: flagellar hook protein FlgE [Comamonas]|jgi:flagellar hook protein FlgE|uniref:Flagellar hook protein FlgE n=1 Tax=Comamonas avium TaxID=2762231 RepID=A0ABR8S8L2_9BURK|nr:MULTISPECIES: flagellar hook protein FlgE [Comamonas]MBD7959829.1 flagellar hook protein FlgE [Comamonas avium]MBD9403482.1 flagellar hook protein FlgE [Comamonas sp. CMM02]